MLPAPNVAPIERCTVVARDGHIVAMGAGIPVPSGAQTIPGDGRFLMAGFWNAHVHFTERQWRSAAKAPSAVLDASLREMLTSRGFTCVVDTGSDPRITLPLARRVEAGELRGPAIVTAGTGLYPPRGLPYYLKGEIPFWVRPLLPQPATPAAAVTRRGPDHRSGREPHQTVHGLVRRPGESGAHAGGGRSGGGRSGASPPRTRLQPPVQPGGDRLSPSVRASTCSRIPPTRPKGSTMPCSWRSSGGGWR